MKISKLTFVSKFIIGLLALLIIFLLFAPYLPTQMSVVTNVSLVSPPANGGTLLLVKGFSPYDSYDRIVSLFDKGVEVARIITPLHRDGSLPNSFTQSIELPYVVTGALTWKVTDDSQLWNVSYSIEARAPQNTSDIISLFSSAQISANSGYNYSINVTSPDEIVYILISGHSTLESVGSLNLKVDSQTYTVFNWHPLNDDAKLTTVGYLIPYISMPLSMGTHILQFFAPTLPANSQYFYVSVFGVYPSS